MSDTKIIRALLVASEALSALVPPKRVFFGLIKQGEVLPAIALNTISSIERERVEDIGAFALTTSRTQVTVQAKSYADQVEVIRLIGLAIRGGRREVAGLLVADIRRDIIGPDMRDDDATIFMQTYDFRVIYNKPLT